MRNVITEGLANALRVQGLSRKRADQRAKASTPYRSSGKDRVPANLRGIPSRTVQQVELVPVVDPTVRRRDRRADARAAK